MLGGSGMHVPVIAAQRQMAGVASLLVLAGAASGASAAPTTPGSTSPSAIVQTDDFRTGRVTTSPWRSALAGRLAARQGRREHAAGPTRSVIVVLVNFTNDRSEPIAPDAARQLVFGATGSVRALYQEETFGKVMLAGRTRPDGDVLGWLPLTSDNAGCRSDAWSVEADRLALARGVNLANYDHVVFAWPRSAGCTWAGRASVPGSVAWINGAFTVRALSHELGHNLGLHHATSIRCTEGTTPVPVSANCVRDEYGDPFDHMGNGPGAPHTSAWQKVRAGWLAGTSIRTVATSGEYAVAPLEQLAPGPQLLRIPRCAGGSYWIDARQPFGFDAFGPTDPVARGVVIHANGDVAVPGPTTLIDTAPETESVLDAPLTGGRTFSDPAEGLTVTTLAAGPGGASVAVRMAPPGRPTGLTAAVAGPTAVRLTWKPSPGGCRGISVYRVLRDGIEIGTTAQATFVDLNAAPAARASYSVRAVDTAGNPGDASEAARVDPSGPRSAVTARPDAVVGVPKVDGAGGAVTVTSSVHGARRGVCRLERVVRGRWRPAGRWSRVDLSGRCRVQTQRGAGRALFRIRFVAAQSSASAAGPTFPLAGRAAARRDGPAPIR